MDHLIIFKKKNELKDERMINQSVAKTDRLFQSLYLNLQKVPNVTLWSEKLLLHQRADCKKLIISCPAVQLVLKTKGNGTRRGQKKKRQT